MRQQPRPAAIISFPEPNYFGDCPVCGRNDGYLNSLSLDKIGRCGRMVGRQPDSRTWAQGPGGAFSADGSCTHRVRRTRRKCPADAR